MDLPLGLVLLVHVEIDDEKGLHFVRHGTVWVGANKSVFENTACGD